jgi:membrane protease YdiL (CAAX protease family)
MGLLFAIYYWKTRQLWPPILAHFLFDLFGLLHHT